MADDNSQRPFRNSDLQSRATPTASNSAGGSNDPLAELARLIGQNDPFGEFGRSGARPAAAPQPAAPVAPAAAPSYAAPEPHDAYAAEDFARQPYGSLPLGGAGDVYHTEAPVPGYEDPAAAMAGYEEAAYDPNLAAPYPGEEQDFYDDIPPPRRRMGVLAIAAVFALAVIGTAGAYGYRALFGSVGSGPPPVIKADSKPAKIVPDKDSQSSKLINDRINDRGGDQKLVSREEQPVDLNNGKPAGVLTQDQSVAAAGAVPAPGLGSGVIGSDPKKIHTITIRPDQPAGAGADPAAAPPQANVAAAMPEQPAMQTAPEPAPPPVARTPAPAPAPRPAATHRPAPVQHRVAAAASNAPLSLSPDAPAPAPMRTASAPSSRSAPARLAPSAAAASGSYAVQVSSRRSQADAQAALNRMQSRFASVIGGQPVMVKRVDLGAKGVYYRAMVGPFGSSDQASKLCGRLKSAGGSCFVQRI